MRKKLVFLIVALLALCSVACVGEQKNETLDLALEALKEPLRLMDQRYLLYTEALEAVQIYVEDPNEATLTTAKQTCSDATTKLTNLPLPELHLEEQLEADMIDIGIRIEDYKVPIEYEEYYRQECNQNLSILILYLDQAPEMNDSLEQLVKLQAEVKAVSRKVDYLCINELFCQFSEKEINDFKDTFLPSLSALSVDGLPWETDSAVLEAKATTLMNDADETMMQYAEFLGDFYRNQ
jgi:hypothetical protein